MSGEPYEVYFFHTEREEKIFDYARKIAYREGQLAMRSRAIAVMCARCAGDWPLTEKHGEAWHVAPEHGHILLPDGHCAAVRLRALEPEEPK